MIFYYYLCVFVCHCLYLSVSTDNLRSRTGTLNMKLWFKFNQLNIKTIFPAIKNIIIIHLFLPKLYSSMLKYYSADWLMWSRLIKLAAYCNQILLAKLCINRAQNTSVNWIIRLLLSFLCWLKVILLNGGHCIWIF
jgi:hypothetical protein